MFHGVFIYEYDGNCKKVVKVVKVVKRVVRVNKDARIGSGRRQGACAARGAGHGGGALIAL